MPGQHAVSLRSTVAGPISPTPRGRASGMNVDQTPDLARLGDAIRRAGARTQGVSLFADKR